MRAVGRKEYDAQTLDLTDVATGWVELAVVLNKTQVWVFQAFERIRQQLPFPLLGVDSDNGTEFINHHTKSYCELEGITLTRSRPYRKNDNCFVEQKNYFATTAIALAPPAPTTPPAVAATRPPRRRGSGFWFLSAWCAATREARPAGSPPDAPATPCTPSSCADRFPAASPKVRRSCGPIPDGSSPATCHHFPDQL